MTGKGADADEADEQRGPDDAQPGAADGGVMLPFASFLKPSDWSEDEQTIFLLPLVSFASDVPTIDLANDTSIRLLSDSERNQLRDKYVFSLPLMTYGFTVDVRRESRDFDAIRAEARKECERVLTSLRLLQPGRISLSYFDSLVYQTDLPISAADENGQTSASYVLISRDLSKLKDIYGGLQADLAAEVELALGRFNWSYDRLPFTSFGSMDSLIDLWVGLEALFAKPGETQELAYRFAIRLAHFIGYTADDRENLFATLKEAYSVRSRVVHGEKVGKGMSVAAAEQATQDALRRSLYRIATERKVPNLDELDRTAVRGSPSGGCA